MFVSLYTMPQSKTGCVCVFNLVILQNVAPLYILTSFVLQFGLLHILANTLLLAMLVSITRMASSILL